MKKKNLHDGCQSQRLICSKLQKKAVQESHCVLVLDIFNVHLTAAW